MKKIYTLLILAFLSMHIFAQDQSNFKFGLKAGVNLNGAKIKFTYEGADIVSKTIISFQFAGYADYAISPSISIQSGLALNGKGGKIEYVSTFSGLTLKGDSTINIMYLEIPLNIVYKINNIYVGAGPYFAYALSGKTKYSREIPGLYNEDGTGKVEFGDDDYLTQLKRSDYGINFLLGYQLESGLNLTAGYALGLRNLVPNPPEDYRVKNSTISLSIGYSF